MAAHQQLLYHLVWSTKERVLKFHWQDGYGAFTVSPSQQDSVVAYIDSQMEHHRKQSFQDEFLAILKRHE